MRRRSECKISDWVESVPKCCMWCGSAGGWLGLQVHHIERRSASISAFRDCPCNLLKLCESCHSGVFDTLDHVKQLRVKRDKDFGSYDLQAWLRIRDPELRAPNRITQEEVDAVVLNLPVSGNGLRF